MKIAQITVTDLVRDYGKANLIKDFKGDSDGAYQELLNVQEKLTNKYFSNGAIEVIEEDLTAIIDWCDSNL